MILARFPSTFLAWIVGTWNCKQQQLRRLSVGKVFSMTQYPGHGQRLPSGPIHAICRGCWLPLSNLWFVWRLELWLCGDTLVPVRLEHGWVFCCLFELTSPSRLEVSQDLPAPIKSVAQQLPTAGQVTAVLQGSEGLSPCTRSTALHLCTACQLQALASTKLLKARCSCYFVQCRYWATWTTPFGVI